MCDNNYGQIPLLANSALPSRYLSEYCVPVAHVATRQHLWSAARHQLTVPWHRLSTYGRRAFAVVGPMAFIAMPDHLRDPSINNATFVRSLKTPCLLLTSTLSALEVLRRNALDKSTYLLTLLYLFCWIFFVFISVNVVGCFQLLCCSCSQFFVWTLIYIRHAQLHVSEDISDGVHVNAATCCQRDRLPRPGSRASSRASSRADWCVSPNVYHREEVAEPNSSRKVTRVNHVACLRLSVSVIGALCVYVWQSFVTCDRLCFVWCTVILIYLFHWHAVLIKQLSLCYLSFCTCLLYRTVESISLHTTLCVFHLSVILAWTSWFWPHPQCWP